MRRTKPIPEFKALSAEQNSQLETWFDDGIPYLKIKALLLEKFGVQVSKDKIARQYHLWRAAEEVGASVNELIAMLNADDLNLENEMSQTMMQKAFLLTLAPDQTPAKLLQLLRIFDYPHRRKLQENRNLRANHQDERASRRLALQEAKLGLASAKPARPQPRKAVTSALTRQAPSATLPSKAQDKLPPGAEVHSPTPPQPEIHQDNKPKSVLSSTSALPVAVSNRPGSNPELYLP